MSKTIFISQDGAANALSLNKDFTQVVIAGRTVFKIFNLEEDEFVEFCNLRVGKHINLNYSCNDVAWSYSDDAILATAATNGSVVVWNLNRSSRSKQEHVFTEHKRTVNKVCFSLMEPFWLMSGSQDGTMKMFDLRTREAIRTFISNTESVRDVQFSPHMHSMFASVSENGNVQTWDIRKPDKCILQFTAHSGPVFACDWHPDQPWLATASRDKTIKVWDMSSKPTVEHTIHTIASVGRVKWRPQYRFQLSSVALVVDSSINVWDIRRPYIPLATFTEHKDVATSMTWKDSVTLLSTSRDCTLYQHSFRDAVDPSAHINPQALAVGADGQVAFACRSNLTSTKTSKVHGLLKKVGNIATGSIVEADFSKLVSSSVFVYSRASRETDWFVECAKQYVLGGKPLADICLHNANVANLLARPSVGQVWLAVKVVYSRLDDEGKEKEVVEPDPQPTEPSETALDSRIGELLFRDSEVEPLSSEFELSEDETVPDWTLPQEAFPVQSEVPPPQNSASEQDVSESEEWCAEVGDATVRWPPWDPTECLARALIHHAYAADVQTPVCVLLALGPHASKPLVDYIDLDTLETWFLTYIELLTRFKLYTHANLVVKSCWLPSVNGINQDSTTVHTGCSSCTKTLTQCGWNCSKCNKPSRCSVCHNIVRGLYAWCQGCMHGGHMDHMRDWLSKKIYCPTGCGHACQLS